MLMNLIPSLLQLQSLIAVQITSTLELEISGWQNLEGMHLFENNMTGKLKTMLTFLISEKIELNLITLI